MKLEQTKTYSEIKKRYLEGMNSIDAKSDVWKNKISQNENLSKGALKIIVHEIYNTEVSKSVGHIGEEFIEEVKIQTDNLWSTLNEIDKNKLLNYLRTMIKLVKGDRSRQIRTKLIKLLEFVDQKALSISDIPKEYSTKIYDEMNFKEEATLK